MEPLSRKEIIDMVSIFKSRLPEMYNACTTLLGFDRKQKMSKNDHLRLTSYYNRIVFYLCMSISRVHFNHRFIFWGMLNTVASYAKGEKLSNTNTFFGNQTCIQTFLCKTKL